MTGYGPDINQAICFKFYWISEVDVGGALETIASGSVVQIASLISDVCREP